MDLNAISNSMASIASGSQINSASDNAAGLLITEKMDTQITAANQNVDNVSSMDNLLSTAEGSLDSISDSLSRMRELAVQASNGTLSDDDKSIIQDEIDALKEGITDSAEGTEFNGIKLLDGSFSDKTTGSNADGSGSKISIASSTLDSLGIEDFDVTGDFSISDLDDAIEAVSESRSSIGSAQNAFEYTTNNLNSKIYNETRSMGNIEDTDIAEEITEMKKNQVLEQYSMMMNKKQMEQQQNRLSAFSGISV